MPFKARRNKHNSQAEQDEQWQQALNTPHELDAAKKQALLNSIHQRIGQRNKRRLFVIGFSAAAAILVAVFIKMPRNDPRSAARKWQELASNEVPRKILLNDGSVLWLAPHSVVQIAADFLQQRNTILTKGTVFFSVAKDAQHPFSIVINRQQVTVLGTAFTIHKLDSVDIQLTVKEGRVALDNVSGRRLLTAGQQVKTTRAATATIGTIDANMADWWFQQQVRWHNITLGELLNQVETYYSVKLSYDAINKKKKVTLTWNLALSLEDNLTVLNSLTGYNIH